LPAEHEEEPEAVVRVGRVGRPHGLDGAFVVEEASEDARRFEVGSTLQVDGERAVVVLSRRVGGGRPAIKLDRAVERGGELTVPRAELPPPESGSYYVADLVGLEVIELEGKRLGVVTDVLPGVANDVLELDNGLLLPLVEDCVRDIDLVQRRVVVAPGFVDHG
jgi:16S rRNA processing protein RimM